MKNIIPYTLSILFALLIGLNVFAANGTQTIKIQTDAICGECKERIEENVVQLKGVRNATLDLKTKVLTVTYNPEKVDAAAIKNAVVETGYMADNLPGNPGKRGALPMCCQK